MEVFGKAELSVRVDGVLGVAATRAYGCDDKQHCLCSEKIYLSNLSYHIDLLLLGAGRALKSPGCSKSYLIPFAGIER